MRLAGIGEVGGRGARELLVEKLLREHWVSAHRQVLRDAWQIPLVVLERVAVLRRPAFGYVPSQRQGGDRRTGSEERRAPSGVDTSDQAVPVVLVHSAGSTASLPCTSPTSLVASILKWYAAPGSRSCTGRSTSASSAARPTVASSVSFPYSVVGP